MRPTMNLRFVERLSTEPTPRLVRVLQQQWIADDDPAVFDWRDVPMAEGE